MANQSLSAPASLCILRLSAIGDVTHILPIIHTLQSEWPDTKITWIIGKLEAQLVDDLPGVEFIIFDKSAGVSGYRDLYRQLKNRRFDVLLHMQAALRASLASWCVRAQTKVGFDRARAIDGQWLFTNKKIAAVPRQHVLDTFFEFLKAIGLESAHYQWPLLLSSADKSYAGSLVVEGQMLVAINPCTSVRARNFRQWPAACYGEVIKYLLNRYECKVVLTGGPSDQERRVSDEIISLVGDERLFSCVGNTSLKQLAAVLERAAVVVSPDTGPAHIANALGTPVVGLYATSNPERTGPYYRDFVVSRYSEALAGEGSDIARVKWGKRVRDPDAMALIAPKDVIDQLNAAIAQSHSCE